MRRMPRVSCDWTMCKHNKQVSEDPNAAGECQKDEVQLVVGEGRNIDELLSCKQFEEEGEKVDHNSSNTAQPSS